MHFTKAENGLARNSESEVNSDSEREFGQAGGRLDYVNFGTYVPRI
jgi:hypothetical protein